MEETMEEVGEMERGGDEEELIFWGLQRVDWRDCFCMSGRDRDPFGENKVSEQRFRGEAMTGGIVSDDSTTVSEVGAGVRVIRGRVGEVKGWRIVTGQGISGEGIAGVGLGEETGIVGN